MLPHLRVRPTLHLHQWLSRVVQSRSLLIQAVQHLCQFPRQALKIEGLNGWVIPGLRASLSRPASLNTLEDTGADLSPIRKIHGNSALRFRKQVRNLASRANIEDRRSRSQRIEELE